MTTHSSGRDPSQPSLQHTPETDDGLNPSELALEASALDAQLTAIDLATALYILKGMGAPRAVMEVLASAMSQVVSLDASLEAVRTGFYAMMAARDEALSTLAQSQTAMDSRTRERDSAREQLKDLEYNMDIWNANDPRVRALIESVWAAAQQDMMKNRGA